VPTFMTASLKINHLRFLYPLNCESLARGFCHWHLLWWPERGRSTRAGVPLRSLARPNNSYPFRLGGSALYLRNFFTTCPIGMEGCAPILVTDRAATADAYTAAS